MPQNVLTLKANLQAKLRVELGFQLTIILAVYGLKQKDEMGSSSSWMPPTSSSIAVAASTTSKCLSFLGVCFGFLLFSAETNIETFFLFFGFLRGRIGRSILYTLAGFMLITMGKNYEARQNFNGGKKRE